MDSFFYDFAFTSEAHGVRDLEGRILVEVSSYGEPARVNCLPEHADPGSPPEIELGALEVITGMDRDARGNFIYTYGPMPTDALGRVLEGLIRDGIDVADVETAAMERAAGDREDHGDWLRDQRRDMMAEGGTP